LSDRDFLRREYSGGCQCGAVRYHATKLRPNPHICYCRMCQKAVGNLGASLVGVKAADIAWTRGTPATFRSSAHVERGFCKDCGTPLFYRHDESQGLSVTIGSLDEPHAVPILYEMGNEGKHPGLPPISGAKQMGTTEETDGAEVVSAIASSNHQHPDHDTEHWP
jgi:hypothetical protein